MVTQTGVAALAPTSKMVKPAMPKASTIFRSTTFPVASLIWSSKCLKSSTMTRAVEFVVLVGVVAEHDAAGGRIDRDVLDARDHVEHLLDLFDQLRVLFYIRHFQANAAGDLVGDLHVHHRGHC